MKTLRLSKKLLLTLLGIIIIGGFALSALHLLPLHFFSVQQKPEQPPQAIYDYYLIIDEKTSEILMYVPLVVSVGDEVLSEDNKHYVIVRVEENRAYARYVKDINLEKYKPPK